MNLPFITADLTGQLAKGLDQTRVGRLLVVAIVLAGGKVAASTRDRPTHLVDQARFAHTRVTRDQHQHTAARDLGEGIHQDPRFPFAAVEVLGDAELVGGIVGAQRKGLDLAMVLPLVQALLQVGGQAHGALVAGLRVLGQQFQHDVGQDRGHGLVLFVGRHGNLGDVAVDQFQGVTGGEHGLAGQHLVEGHTQ